MASVSPTATTVTIASLQAAYQAAIAQEAADQTALAQLNATFAAQQLAAQQTLAADQVEVQATGQALTQALAARANRCSVAKNTDGTYTVISFASGGLQTMQGDDITTPISTPAPSTPAS